MCLFLIRLKASHSYKNWRIGGICLWWQHGLTLQALPGCQQKHWDYQWVSEQTLLLTLTVVSINSLGFAWMRNAFVQVWITKTRCSIHRTSCFILPVLPVQTHPASATPCPGCGRGGEELYSWPTQHICPRPPSQSRLVGTFNCGVISAPPFQWNYRQGKQSRGEELTAGAQLSKLTVI